MTKRHVIDYYMDGHLMVSFCKLCSKEEGALMEPCEPLMTKAEVERNKFEQKYQKALDDSRAKR